jgi:ferric-dicitrate binding protein FerR (iron transport regulator)
MTKDNEYKMTGYAWDNLYRRLEQDGLLMDSVSEPSPRFFTVGRMVGIAAILCVAVVSGLIWMQRSGGDMNDMRTLCNNESLSTLVTMLEDSSVVYLSSEASISYPEHFHKDRREISLRGDAFFDVYQYRGKPFLIDIEPAKIEVLGTSFVVRNRGENEFSLSVMRGEVRVTLKKNNQVVHVSDGVTVRLQSGVLQTVTDDATLFDEYIQRIHFKDERLSDVVHIINMNSSPLRIELATELADRLLTVTFAGEDTRMMAHLICLALDLRQTQRGQTIYISGADD